MDEPRSSSLTAGDAKMDTPSDHRPVKKPRLSMRPSNFRRQSFTDPSVHLPAEHSTAVLPSSEPCTDPADDATISRILSEMIATLNATSCSTSVALRNAFEAKLNDDFEATLNDAFEATFNYTFRPILSDALKAKTAAHKAEMDRHTVAWRGEVDRAYRRCHEAEEKLEKEREQNLAFVGPNERCHDPLANGQLAAEQSGRDAHDIGSSKDGRLAELDIDMLATTNCERDAKLIINGITILNTKVNRLAKEQELKLRDQLREIFSLANGNSAPVRTAFAPHGTTPSSRASQISDTASVHPEQLSTSPRTDEHTKGFDGLV